MLTGSSPSDEPNRSHDAAAAASTPTTRSKNTAQRTHRRNGASGRRTDADGVANGVIVDPSGLVSPSSLDTSALENDSSVSSGSNGCFINSLQEISVKEIESKSYWVMIEFIFLFLTALAFIRQSTKNNIRKN